MPQVLLQRGVLGDGPQRLAGGIQGSANVFHGGSDLWRDVVVEGLDELLRAAERAFERCHGPLEIGADLIVGNLVQLDGNLADLGLQFVQAVGNGRQAQRVNRRRRHRRADLLVLEEVQRHVELPGQQVAHPQLAPQAAGDHGLQPVR
jgi:hypothetical protein